MVLFLAEGAISRTGSWEGGRDATGDKEYARRETDQDRAHEFYNLMFRSRRKRAAQAAMPGEVGKLEALVGRRDLTGAGSLFLKDGKRSPSEAKEARECMSASRKEERVTEPDTGVLGDMETNSRSVGAVSVNEKRVTQVGGVLTVKQTYADVAWPGAKSERKCAGSYRQGARRAPLLPGEC